MNEQQFFDALTILIKKFENTPYNNQIHFDINHIPTLGYGYALLVETPIGYEVRDGIISDLAAFGITINNNGVYDNPATNPELADEWDILQTMANDLNTNPSQNPNLYGINWTLRETDATTLLGNVLQSNLYKQNLIDRLGTDVFNRFYNSVTGEYSEELLALWSMEYNNGYKLIGPKPNIDFFPIANA